MKFLESHGISRENWTKSGKIIEFWKQYVAVPKCNLYVNIIINIMTQRIILGALHHRLYGLYWTKLHGNGTFHKSPSGSKQIFTSVKWGTLGIHLVHQHIAPSVRERFTSKFPCCLSKLFIWSWLHFTGLYQGKSLIVDVLLSWCTKRFYIISPCAKHLESIHWYMFAS